MDAACTISSFGIIIEFRLAACRWYTIPRRKCVVIYASPVVVGPAKTLDGNLSVGRTASQLRERAHQLERDKLQFDRRQSWLRAIIRLHLGSKRLILTLVSSSTIGVNRGIANKLRTQTPDSPSAPCRASHFPKASTIDFRGLLRSAILIPPLYVCVFLSSLHRPVYT